MSDAYEDAKRMRIARTALITAASRMNETLACPRTFLERCFALSEDIDELVEQLDEKAYRETRKALRKASK